MEHAEQSGAGRPASQAEAYALSDIRQMEGKWNGLVGRVKAIPDVDLRQVSIAVTEAEGAFMRLTRAILRPEPAVEPSFAAIVADLREEQLRELEAAVAQPDLHPVEAVR